MLYVSLLWKLKWHVLRELVLREEVFSSGASAFVVLDVLSIEIKFQPLGSTKSDSKGV